MNSRTFLALTVAASAFAAPALADDAKIAAGKTSLQQAIDTLSAENETNVVKAEKLMKEALALLSAPPPAVQAAPAAPVAKSAPAAPAPSPASTTAPAAADIPAGYKAWPVLIVRQGATDPTDFSGEALSTKAFTGTPFGIKSLKVPVTTGTAPIFELQGWIVAKEAGHYNFSAKISDLAVGNAPWYANCALSAVIEDTPAFTTGAMMEDFKTRSVMMNGGFDVQGAGLYKTQIRVACGNYDNRGDGRLHDPSENVALSIKGPGDDNFRNFKPGDLVHK